MTTAGGWYHTSLATSRPRSLFGGKACRHSLPLLIQEAALPSKNTGAQSVKAGNLSAALRAIEAGKKIDPGAPQQLDCR